MCPDYPVVLPDVRCPVCDCRIFLSWGKMLDTGDSKFTVKCTSHCGFKYYVLVDAADMDRSGRDAALTAARDGWTALKLREL